MKMKTKSLIFEVGQKCKEIRTIEVIIDKEIFLSVKVILEHIQKTRPFELMKVLSRMKELRLVDY